MPEKPRQCAETCPVNIIDLEPAGACVGCGYCFQVCPTGALDAPAGDILASAYPE